MKKYSLIIATISLLLASCTKEIKIDLNKSNSQFVIQGDITDQQGPYTVKLNKTVNFSDANNFPAVTGALVVISDNIGTNDTLSETSAGVYQTHTIVGTQGNTYTLMVIADGKQFDAITTMPNKVNFDSISFNATTDPGSTDEVFGVLPVFTDPIQKGNNYRFFISSNGITDPAFLVTNDFQGNGAINQHDFSVNDLTIKIKAGDTVKVSMLCIDEKTYNYFYSLSVVSDNNPVFGTTPFNPPNNITTNKALGYFAAYTIQTMMAEAK